MCTVSFVPAGDRCYLTSNRDEKYFRSDALAPEIHTLNTGKLLYPRDRDANGTWFALHETGHVVVFLNGGFVKHEPAPPYRKSRGLILLEIADSHTPVARFEQINLENIEPFTAIIYSKRQLFECRWDGNEKFLAPKNATKPHIWSSATLYGPEIISKRNRWFENWLKKHPEADAEAILHFHEFSGEGDSYNDLKMNRDGLVFTVSITSVTLEKDRGRMIYLDLKNQQESEKELSFHQPIQVH